MAPSASSAAIGVALLAAILLSPASAAAKKASHATKPARHVTYCGARRHPSGCVTVPAGARRPPRTFDEQGGRTLTPPDVVNGGGLGGGPTEGRKAALSWARTQLGSSIWAYRCERFVEEAYGTRFRYPTAWGAATHVMLHRGPIATAPAGALVYFAPDSFNRGYGHVGLSLGGGSMLSALDTVQITDVRRSHYWGGLYRGWAAAPASWPGRLPPPPGPTGPLVSSLVQVTAPAFGSTVGGVVRLAASAENVGGVAFDAFYASDPGNSQTAGWHQLGNATPDGGSWTLAWDTSGVPDQGNAQWGTINIAAIALDASGKRTGTRDYRRISVNNSSTNPPTNTTPPPSVAPPTPSPTPTPSTPSSPPPIIAPPASTHAETVGGDAHTWSDYTNAGGTQGPTIPSNTTVQIACKVSGFRVADGDSWWYRIASSPWNGRYYVSADAFYNNGQTSGSLSGTPFFDPNVPDC